ncbi:hypothetical protein WJX72_006090 [[Myrmecia] bisecta]|uniref:TFIIS N-terminal domain-containing protein n=1 Tax=[Myrmecia] bisecta TaxID=41462 RepID=A0AAW1PAV1_9CHLO
MEQSDVPRYEHAAAKFPNRCAACGSNHTSGLWRRGWVVNGSTVNLCNKCGLRVKRAASKDTTQTASFYTAFTQSATPESQHQSASFHTALASDARGPHHQPLSAQAEMDHQQHEAGQWGMSAAMTAAMLQGPMHAVEGEEMHQVQDGVDLPMPTADSLTRMPFPEYGAAPAPARSGTQYVSYHIQRKMLRDSVVTLFWLQDDEGGNTLAVMGSDPKQSGHFTYTSLPTFTAASRALRCTNRNDVMAWIATFGATRPNNDAQVPEFAPGELEKMVTGDPLWARPELDRNYSTYKEETGELDDGRHFKNYFLLEEATGAHKLAVSGLDGPRRDRRYEYKAHPDFGSFAFENSREVVDWLEFILGRRAAPVGAGTPPKKPRKKKGALSQDGALLPSGPRPRKKPNRLTLEQLGGPPNQLGNGQPVWTEGACVRCAYQGHTELECPFTIDLGAQPGDPHFAVTPDQVGHLTSTPSTEVKNVFGPHPPLFQWVTSMPSTEQISHLRYLGARLSGVVADAPPEEVGVDQLGKPRVWLPTSDAILMLQELSQTKANLKLLEMTDIAAPVAALRTHPNRQLAALAQQVAEGWRTAAADALKYAMAALQQ